MRINAAAMNTKAFKYSFKSLRTDKKTVEQLKKGEQPIIDNNKQNIYAALNNLTVHSGRESIEFLLDISENLAYGQGGANSEFKDFLDSESLTPSERENTDWEAILDDTIRKAISSSDEDVSDLETEYQRIFSDKREMTPMQKKLIELRNEFTSLILNEETVEEAETLARTAKVRKNLDYFIASSEIPAKQKQYCLERFIYLMSDDYKITPQLKDRKLQVVDEMLNDMLIKTPESSELTIKTVDQRQSGMCAAISACRKQIAYEDKSGYVDLIMEELEDSPVMSVYDVTELGTGRKVDIEKTHVDYDTAIAKGYRIIDASAHNWMHNAHASGDGTIQTEYYVPFSDEADYGVYNDSSWYLGTSEDNAEAKSLLQILIKEKEYLQSFLNTKKEMQEANRNVSAVKKEVNESLSASGGKLNSVLREIFPEKSNAELSDLQRSILKFYSGKSEENEANVGKKLPHEVKQQLLADFVIDSASDITDEQKNKVLEKSKVIYLMADEYTSSEEKLRKLNKFSTPKSRYIYNRKLFNLAAAHRLAMEADVNMPDGVVRFERFTGLPPRDIQITDYLKSLKSSTTPFKPLKGQTADEESISSKDELEQELASDIVQIETTIPTKLDLISKTLFGRSLVQLTADTYHSIAENIKHGDKELLENTKAMMNIDGDKNRVVDKLEKQEEKLNNSPSSRETLEAIRLLGYENSFEFVSVYINSFFNSLRGGISEEQYCELAKRFGGEDKIVSGLEFQKQSFDELKEDYNAIQKKWQVPSARENILGQLEKQKAILSRKKLDILKNKFDFILAQSAKNEKIQNMKERNAANNKLYKFSTEEKELLEIIEKSVPAMKKYCKMEYSALNDILFDELEAQYAYIGKLNGQFWVREEGSSGLSANEQIRIIEQMTGKPHYIESDITEAAQVIKQGKGSGVISLSVDDKDYAFHAQYVPSVTTETFTKPASTDKVVRDVVWTDNSWGDCEKEYFWNGHNGFYYTDYARGFGWKDGFILAPDKKIGLSVDSINGGVGVEENDNEEFGLYVDTILPGMPVNSYQKLYKMFNCIFDMNEGEILLNALESDIKDGARFSIEELEGLDEAAEHREAVLTKRLDSEIKTEADFDKLSDDDPLKFAFKKLAVYMSTDNPDAAERVLLADNNEALEKAYEDIVEEHLEQFTAILGKSPETLNTLSDLCEADIEPKLKEAGIDLSDEDFAKILDLIFFDEKSLSDDKALDSSLDNLEKYLLNRTVHTAVNEFNNEQDARRFIEIMQASISKNIDENVRIKSLDSTVIQNSPLGDEFIAAIDKYLEPKSDEELLMLLQGLQMADMDTVEEFINALEDKDLAVKYKDPYHYVQLYKAENSAVRKTFSEVVAAQVIYSNLNCSDDEEDSTPEEIYRSLYVKLSEMDVQKYIKAFKAEAFREYNVRQAFPQPVVLPDESIAQTAADMLEHLEEQVNDIEVYGYLIDVFSKYSEFIDNFSHSDVFEALINQHDFEITDDNSETADDFLKTLVDLYESSSIDESLEPINAPLGELISVINNSDTLIDGKAAGTLLAKVIKVFDEFESAGVTQDKYKELKKTELSELKKNIQLMINANVEPRYRNDAFELINKYVDLYRKEAPDEVLKEQTDIISNFIADKHIVKNPTVLLKEFTKLLMEGKSETDEYDVLRLYLVSALKVAQETKVQYKMVQNQHEGFSSKIKDMLPLFSVVLEDGSKVSMDTETGMLYLIEQLKNPADENSTLRLLLEQSGLAEKAVSAALNNFDINKTREMIDEKATEFKSSIKYIEKIAAETEKFFSSSRIKYNSIEDAVNQLKKYMKRKLKKYEQVPVYNTYITYLESLTYGDVSINMSQEMIKSLAQEINMDAMEYTADYMTVNLNFIKEISEMLEERAFLLDSISIPETGEVYSRRENFFNEYNDTQDYLETLYNELVNYANNSTIVSAQPQ